MIENTPSSVVARGKPDAMRELQRFLAGRGIPARIESPPPEEGGCGTG